MRTMSVGEIVRTDSQGAVNAKLMRREVMADYRRVEAASLKVKSHLCSPEGKRIFLRYYTSVQLHVYWINGIARIRLQGYDIRRVEDAIKEKLDKLNRKLDSATTGAETLLRRHGVSGFANYDVVPLEVEVPIMSAIARRYFEAINKLDRLMPLLQTLEILEVIDTDQGDLTRAELKKGFRSVAGSSRDFVRRLRMRIDELHPISGAREIEPGMATDSTSPDQSVSSIAADYSSTIDGLVVAEPANAAEAQALADEFDAISQAPEAQA